MIRLYSYIYYVDVEEHNIKEIIKEIPHSKSTVCFHKQVIMYEKDSNAVIKKTDRFWTIMKKVDIVSQLENYKNTVAFNEKVKGILSE